MLYGGGLVFVAELCLVVYCVLNVITTPEADVRNLPKLLWLVLVLLFPIIGGVAWLVAGRPQSPARSLPYKGNAGQPPSAYDRPARAKAISPDDDEAFLRGLEQRAQQQRKKAEQESRAREAGPDA